MSKRFSWLWQRLGARRQRQRARRQELRQRRREQQRLLWGGPVEADRVLAFSDAIFAIAITLLTLNLQVPAGLHGADFTRALHQTLPALGAYALSFVILGQLWLAHHRIFGVIARVDYTVLVRNLLFLGLIAIMPFPVRLLSDYTRQPLAVAIYALAFITAMQLQRLIWLDVTRPEHRELLKEPVPEAVRSGFGRVLLGMLVVFGAAVPVGMFAPRYATLVWAVIIPLRLLVGRLTNWPSWRPTGT
jgi:TMEM175 potassium channel family protein